MFETTIRILGGLAAAFYHSGGDELFLLKAIEFADRQAACVSVAWSECAALYMGRGLRVNVLWFGVG